MKITLLSLLCMILIGSAYQEVHAATLKVYNMHRNVFNGKTYPASNCGHGKDYCSIIPYQSIFRTNAVIFELPDQAMNYFYWEGIVGPRYKIEVNLGKDEYATLELYADGGYKFKNRLIEYTNEL